MHLLKQEFLKAGKRYISLCYNVFFYKEDGNKDFKSGGFNLEHGY